MHNYFWTGLVLLVLAIIIATVIPSSHIMLSIAGLMQLVGVILMILGIILTITRRKR